MPTNDEVVARQGEKMIELKVRFWTNGIATAPNHIRQKHAWSAGVVRMEPNESHNLVPERPIVFRSLLDLGTVIEKALIAHDIKLHSSQKMRRYWADE